MSHSPEAKGGPVAAGGSRQGHPIKTRATAEAGSRKGPSYRPVATQFPHHGFNYRQIAREGDAAIYEQTRAGCSNPSVRYEVIRIRRRDGFQIGERFVEPSEVYPNSEAWGVDGFTFTDKVAAFGRLREINSMICPLRRAKTDRRSRKSIQNMPSWKAGVQV